MKKYFFILGLMTLIISACSSDEDPMGCYEFHHSIRYRSPNSDWVNYCDTVCNISESRAEEIRVLNDQNDSKWIHNCSKRKITNQHTHVTNSFYK